VARPVTVRRGHLPPKRRRRDTTLEQVWWGSRAVSVLAYYAGMRHSAATAAGLGAGGGTDDDSAARPAGRGVNAPQPDGRGSYFSEVLSEPEALDSADSGVASESSCRRMRAASARCARRFRLARSYVCFFFAIFALLIVCAAFPDTIVKSNAPTHLYQAAPPTRPEL
jgi:hypothetical protein